MAIYPLRNSHVANFDCLRSQAFKSGMILIRDSNGYAVKADRSSFSLDFLNEQSGKFLGFASGDHDLNNNIILSDPVGGSYIDSNGRLIDNVNSHYGVYKRSIAEFSDENVSRYYNIFDSSSLTRRGVGVFNLEGEYYITDQFSPVLALTFSGDGNSVVNLDSGDLLTIGAGVNAGKLVKVDTSGFGPSVLVVGVVEKYDAGTNLLTFRHILREYNNSVSYSTSGLYLNLDASSNVSYPGSGTTWFDLSGNSLNGSMNNGTTWNSAYGGIMRLDSTDDNIIIADNPLFDFSGDFTIEIMYYPNEITLHGILGKWVTGGSLLGNTWIIGSFFGTSPGASIFWNSLTTSGGAFVSTPTLYTNYNWYSVIVTRNSGIMSIYINGLFQVSASNTPNFTNPNPIIITQWANFNAGCDVAAVRIYNVGFNSAKAQQNYNSIYSRMFV